MSKNGTKKLRAYIHIKERWTSKVINECTVPKWVSRFLLLCPMLNHYLLCTSSASWRELVHLMLSCLMTWPFWLFVTIKQIYEQSSCLYLEIYYIAFYKIYSFISAEKRLVCSEFKLFLSRKPIKYTFSFLLYTFDILALATVLVFNLSTGIYKIY